MPAMGSQEVGDCRGRRGATHPLPLHSRQLHARLQDTTCKQDGRQADTVKWAVGEIGNVKNRFNLSSIQRVSILMNIIQGGNCSITCIDK